MATAPCSSSNARRRTGPTSPTRPGLFVYQFETIARNRLGYLDGLTAMAADPFYDADWQAYIEHGPHGRWATSTSPTWCTCGRSCTCSEQRRRNPAFEPSVPPLFGEKEGKIAKASRGRDPLYLFAALQRQLGYPEVPRFKVRDDAATKLEQIADEGAGAGAAAEAGRGRDPRRAVDLSQFGKPDLLKDDDEV